jgi:hypothetical protein
MNGTPGESLPGNDTMNTGNKGASKPFKSASTKLLVEKIKATQLDVSSRCVSQINSTAMGVIDKMENAD